MNNKEWVPDETEIEEYFVRGVEEEYSLTANPKLLNARQAFRNWLHSHDRHVAENTQETS